MKNFAKSIDSCCLLRIMCLVLACLNITNFAWAGSIISWGSDSYGQVSDTPIGNDFIAIASGYRHSLALKSDGTIVSWGRDEYEQVTSTPTDSGYIAIAGGYYHSLALKSDGTIVSWGRDSSGQVTDTPTDSGYVDIEGGWGHSLARKSDGSIIAWGSDTYNQVSDKPTGSDFSDIACGGYHSLALKSDGSIVSWGEDDEGEVSQTPTSYDFAIISGGGDHSVALKTDGSIVSWGNNYYGNVISDTPTGNDFIDIAGAWRHSLALASDGSIVAWGWDSDGQVSDAPGGCGFIDIAGGGYHSLALFYEPPCGFSDDFEGTTLDTSLWSVFVDAHGEYNWPYVADGLLHSQGYHTRIDSIPTFSPMGQRVIARARIKLGGILNKFGFAVNPNERPCPTTGYYFDTLDVEAEEHYIWALAWSNPCSVSTINLLKVKIPVTWYEFHEFAIERAPSEVIYSIDGQEVARIADTCEDALPVGVWNDRWSLMQTDWVGVNCEAELTISVDIKPTSCPNPLNVKSNGVLPVAILGTEDFDVSAIDVATIMLEGVDPIRSNYEDVATPVSDRNECDCTTEGPDGYMDLTLKFNTQDIVAMLGEVDHGDELTLTLEGALFEELCGVPIQGADCIVIRGKHKPLNEADINKDGVVN